MKLSLGQLMDAGTRVMPGPNGLENVPGALDRFRQQNLPIKTSTRLAMILKAARPFAEVFNEKRNDLYKQHGVQNPENPAEYRLETQEQVDAFNEDFVELRNT